MEVSNIHLAYFSATYTTRKIVEKIARQISSNIIQHDITNTVPSDYVRIHGEGELFIVGVPVYAGRVPSSALLALNKFKGNGAPAIIVCVYGNREYDDALLELKDIVENNGFKVIAAGTFIAQHSIFPQVAANRPDKKDWEKIDAFGTDCAKLLSTEERIKFLPDLQVKGNRPYKIPGNIPIHPVGDKHCNKCGACVKLCPVQAISIENPSKTDKQKCISCGRCLVICPQKSRHFGGLLYKIARWKFVKDNSQRKEPELFMSSM